MTARALAILSLLCLAPCLTGCFTGVETTPRISDRQVRKGQRSPAPERLLLDPVAPQASSQWTAGKPFIATDGKLPLAYRPASVAETVCVGDTLRLIGVSRSRTIGGQPVATVGLLTNRGDTLVCSQQVSDSAYIELPFLNDARAIALADSLLHNRTLWTLTRQRYTLQGQPLKGLKYEKVTVKEVVNGNAEFPMRVVFTSDGSGDTQMLYLTYNRRTGSPRRFEVLFSLTDPRNRYPEIGNDTWLMICQGQTAPGMTAAECRLALGSPDDIIRNVTYGGIAEQWVYADGTRLHFIDGVRQ